VNNKTIATLCDKLFLPPGGKRIELNFGKHLFILVTESHLWTLYKVFAR